MNGARCASLALLVAYAPSAFADDIATTRQRALDAETGGTSSDTNVVNDQKGTASSAATYLAKENAQGKFSDIGYTHFDASASPYDPATHYARLHVMAAAYNTQGQSTYHDPALLTGIVNGIAEGNAFYCGSACARVGNWWYWEIGNPLDLAPTLLLMQDAMVTGSTATSASKTAFANAENALKFYMGDTPDGPGWSGAPHPNTGQNLVWDSFNFFYVDLIDKNQTELSGVVTPAMESALELVPSAADKVQGDGLFADGSFQQHTGQPYTGGYGSGFANDLSRFYYFTDGTAFALSAQSLANYNRYIAAGTIWTITGDEYDVSVIGREVTRSGERATQGLEALLRMSLVAAPEDKDAIVSATKQMLSVWPNGYPVSVASLAAQVKALPQAAAWPSGFKHFPNSDHSVYRRPGVYASIKMLSKRTKSGELVNAEGKVGSRQSDGRLYLVLNGDEYFNTSKTPKNVWPTMDWARLPGITVEAQANAASSNYGDGTTTFAGGVSDGQNGVSAMLVQPIGSVLTAKKSWVFFDDAIVFLTSDIQCPANGGTSNPAETIIEQWPVQNAASKLVVDGTDQGATEGFEKTLSGTHWADFDGLGYLFLDDKPVLAELKTQAGAWSDLGAGDSTSHQNQFLTLSVPHGKNAAGASSAYAIVPASSGSAATQAISDAKPITVVENDATLSAVEETKKGEIGVAFWASGTAKGTVAQLGSDAPSVVWLHDDGTTVTVSAADPSQGGGSFHVTLAEPLIQVSADPGVSMSSDATSTTITFPQKDGLSTSIKLTHPGSSGVGGSASTAEGGASASTSSGKSGGSTGSAGGSDGGAGGSGGNGSSTKSGGCSCELADRGGSGETSLILTLGAAAVIVGSRRRASKG